VNRPSANDPDLDALLGAYALDALEPDERARVDEYLANNQAARDEVDELRESAASLALVPAHDVNAPTELWNRIASRLADEPRAFTPISRERRVFSPRVVTGLAVAAAIAIVVLAVSVVVLERRDSRTGDLAAAFDNARTKQGAHEVALTPGSGVAVARIVLLPDGTGYLKNDGMKPLPPDRTYQLWALSGSRDKPVAISAGVLGNSPGAVAFHTSRDVHGFAVTVEQAPGVVSSTQPMYASASVT
jgi:anti-sigma-K factor RskA